MHVLTIATLLVCNTLSPQHHPVHHHPAHHPVIVQHVAAAPAAPVTPPPVVPPPAPEPPPPAPVPDPVPVPVPAPTPIESPENASGGDIQSIIIAAANRYGVSARYLLAVARCESTFNIYAYNPSGATGLFQFMPATFYGNGGTNIYSAYDQADVAARMFSQGQAHQWVCA